MTGSLPEIRLQHDRAWRDQAAVAAHWREAADVDRALLRSRETGTFWDELERLGVLLVVSREYEHFVVGLTVRDGRPEVTYLALPHPSGIAVDRDGARVTVACTRNPNQLVDLRPVEDPQAGGERVLVPRTATFHPGRLYLHDLAFVDGRLHANATGLNAIVRLEPVDVAEPVWWPAAVEREGEPDLERNTLQLNSIAAGRTLAQSYFSASAAVPSARRPGHRNFPVDGRGVIFSGATREPIVAGLTRPHSARLDGDGRLWVDNSGYGEVGTVEDGRFCAVARLPGWTRGLCVVDDVVIVGTSRVIPRFSQYAPGLGVRGSVCGLHIVDPRTGETRGSLIWPSGNQIFAVERMPADRCVGFPFAVGGRRPERVRSLFYGFQV